MKKLVEKIVYFELKVKTAIFKPSEYVYGKLKMYCLHMAAIVAIA